MIQNKEIGYMIENRIQKLLWLYIGIAVIFCGYIYCFVAKANGDNVEHLHFSWLVWQGYVPYKDFFQHHNPLTWYLFAPLVNLLINNSRIFSIFNLISYGAVGLMAYYQYRIMILNHNSKTSGIFLLAAIISSYSILWALNFRPDTFAYTLLFMGMLYLFKYVEVKRLWMLVVSFLIFFIAFMFTQKVLINLVVPAMGIIYWLYKREISFKDLALACVLPILLLGVWCAYLYNEDILQLYWVSNFLYNTHIPEIFAQNRIIFPPQEYFEFYMFIPTGCLATIYFLIKGNAFEKIISFMFVEETILRLFYFSAFLHYSIVWLILGMMITVMCADKIFKNKILKISLGAVYLIFSLWYSYNFSYKVEAPKLEYMNGHEFAFENLTPCDYAINGYYSVYNLKAKDAGYYAVLLGQIDVLGEKTGIAPKADLNKIIQTKRPKLISAGIYWDTYWEQRGIQVPAHQIDQSLVDKYYYYTGIGDIFILKPEYQKHDCRYIEGKWEYRD